MTLRPFGVILYIDSVDKNYLKKTDPDGIREKEKRMTMKAFLQESPGAVRGTLVTKIDIRGQDKSQDLFYPEGIRLCQPNGWPDNEVTLTAGDREMLDGREVVQVTLTRSGGNGQIEREVILLPVGITREVKTVVFTSLRIGSGEFIPDKKNFFFTWRGEMFQELASALAPDTEPDSAGYYNPADVVKTLTESDFDTFVAEVEVAAGRSGMSLTQACIWRCQN